MARVLIDGVEYEVREGDNLLAVALGLGISLPYFCWHPSLGSVGACRQCAVKQYKDENDTRGKLVMACMVKVAEGARFTVQDRESAAFRASVIEWLMLNHPHDCPVCDEGGECHLQDMTVLTGHVYRRTTFPKRTYVSQDLGPFLTHEMNRCITCYRCVRFYQDYAGGSDLRAFASKNHVWFGRESDGPLESPFSGNLVEVCPTGVFTDKTLARHYTRKWDLQSAPTLCVHCGMGCNTLAAERYGTLRRVSNRYHHDINGYFLCDRGRFGYEFVNAADRIRKPRFAFAGERLEVALQRLHGRLQGMRLLGIGSPRASLEANYALRHLVGPENFYSGLNAREQRLAKRVLQAVRQARVWSVKETEACDAVVVLGEDVEATNPRLSLALRQAVRNAALAHADELGVPRWQDTSVRDAAEGIRSPLYVLSPLPTALDAVAQAAMRLRPEEVARSTAQLAGLLRGDAGPVTEALREMAGRLRKADRVALVVGAVQGSEAIVDAGLELLSALAGSGKEAGLVVTVPECNTMTAALLDGKPIEALTAGERTAWIVLENDLFRRMDEARLDDRLQGAGLVVALDSLRTRTTDRAHVVLPAAPPAEGNGIYVNNEGRAQRSWQVYVPPEPVRDSWRWFALIGSALGRTPPWQTVGDVFAAAAAEFDELAPAVQPLTAPVPAGWRIARESHRYSGRTAMGADRSVFEPPPPVDADSPFAFSMEGYGGPVPARLAPRYWAPGWNSWQALNFYQQEVGGELRGGEAGVRLFTHATEPQGVVERTPETETTGWTGVPLHRVFGSEELSARAPAVAARAPRGCAALHPQDAEQLGLRAGEEIEIECEGRCWRAPLALLEMARGLVAVSIGIAPFGFFPLYRPVTLRRPA